MRVDGYNPEMTIQGMPRPAVREPSARAASRGSAPVDTATLSAEAVLRITNEALESEFGAKISASFEEHGIDLSRYTGMDWSPEATAKRIFDFASGMLEVWRGQNPKMDESALIDSFEETIRGAVDEGYQSAVGVLEGMGAGDETLDVSRRTMSELSRLFDDFFAKLRGGDEKDATADASDDGVAAE